MNKKILAAVGVIALGCIGMLIWAWRSGDSVLVITMAVALVLICGVGSLPVIFNTQGRKSNDHEREVRIVSSDEVDHNA